MKTLYRFFKEFGIDFKKMISGFKNIGWFLFDYNNFKKSLKNKKWKISTLHPCLHDKSDNAGQGMGHYFNQDLLVAQKIFKNNPKKHVDIGSSVSGFVSNVASFREIEVFDIRPLKINIDNIIFKQQDLMELDENYINYTDSVSSLHVLEHFGLGRYGDPIDVDGYEKGFANIVKILKRGGIFYFSVPIGKEQRIEFNAHRVFSIRTILDLANKNDMEAISFSYVDDSGMLHKNINLTKNQVEKTLNLNWGCGIWEFIKK